MHFLCSVCELHFDRKRGRIFHTYFLSLDMDWHAAFCFGLKETRKGNDHLVVMIGGDLMKGSQELDRSVFVLENASMYLQRKHQSLKILNKNENWWICENSRVPWAISFCCHFCRSKPKLWVLTWWWTLDNTGCPMSIWPSNVGGFRCCSPWFPLLSLFCFPFDRNPLFT